MDSIAKQNTKLNPHHEKQLKESGLSDETILEAGIYSESQPVKIRSLLKCSERMAKSLGACLVIPFHDLDGRNGYARVRPDKPRTFDGKPNKYESPKGEPNQIYIPPGMADKLTTKFDLIITEGEKKALKAKQEGFPSIGLVGVFGWKKRSEAALLPTLERIDWSGRNVFIAFDSDIREKPQVQQAESWLCHHLAMRGAIVKVVRFPDGEPGKDSKPSKVGLDDYLVANGAAAFQKLLETAIDPVEIAAEVEKRNAKVADPATEAARIIQEATVDGCSKLRYWSGSFWFWSNGRYAEVPSSEVRAIITNHLNRNYCMVGTTPVSNTLEQVRAQTILPSSKQPPSWLKTHHWKPEDIIATKNSIVHLPSYVDGVRPYSIDASPSFFSTSAVDYVFDETKPPCDRWKQFLAELWPEDQDSINLLQEWFGNCLTPDTRLQKMLLMLGPRRSGKGTIARVHRAVVGEQNVCGPTLASLQTNFGLWPLLGKSVAIISDARLSGRSDQAIITERLLSISGEDAQTVDRKNLEPVTTKLSTRFVIISNELPRLHDASGALAGRMVILQLTESFYGKEDRNLSDALLQERPGILHWAIEGWQRLRHRGHFIQPESGEQLKNQLDELSSPITAFVADECVVDDRYKVPVNDIYQSWVTWCNDAGRDPGSIQVFGRDLTALLPRLRVKQTRFGAHRSRTYEGIGLVSRDDTRV